MLAPSAALAAPSLPLPAMHPASFLSVTSAEGSSGLQEQQLVHGAASPSPPPPATRAFGGVGIIRCQDCAHRRCCFCCSSRGLVCPAHDPADQCSDRHHTLAASASTAATVAATRKRPRAHHSVASPTTTSSSVGQPTAATAPERFARELSLDGVVFRRVRLGPNNAEVAYHATVTIGGHVFRGVLYDVGPRSRRSSASTDTAGSSDESSRSTAGGGLDLTLRL